MRSGLWLLGGFAAGVLLTFWCTQQDLEDSRKAIAAADKAVQNANASVERAQAEVDQWRRWTNIILARRGCNGPLH